MSKAKGKGGTGRGTGKKGWNRWQASAKKAKSAKPYKSKGVKNSDGTETTINGDKFEK
ncbi:DUF3934 family protein [Priestia filamentosa]|uniref:DUF3934 family protein n=1 Tax=Priestia filamentosa TaxID=1402861 RepID=UPI001FB225E0|nr:DUF3934 family protein [Priestia filamentosa]MED3729562.1 DUF3934 family protein [Priestia filamentosa]UOE62968.1 DUF3934 family protein [Priestia filamentosa]